MCESSQRCFYADTGLRDRRFKLGVAKGQGVGTRECAEQHGSNCAFLRGGERGKISEDRVLGVRLCDSEQCGTIDAPIAHRDAFGHRINTMGRGDQSRAIRRHQTALYCAPGFHQFGGDDDVHFARSGHQGQHGRVGVLSVLLEEFEVVNCRARALRHTGY